MRALLDHVHAPALIDVEATQTLRGLLRASKIDVERAEQAREDLADLAIWRHPDANLLRRAWELRDVCTTIPSEHLQANRKMLEGTSHPDRDAQFAHINATVAAAQTAGQPTISVDTKKKELVGDFKNAGREWRPKGKPVLVRTKDFKDKQLGKVNPYGVYDLKLDEGFVSVGIDADTAQFAVQSIRSWWRHIGHRHYPDATILTITADCGGSNGNRLRLWKVELQKLADETALQIRVCHFPPGTSKWKRSSRRSPATGAPDHGLRRSLRRDSPRPPG